MLLQPPEHQLCSPGLLFSPALLCFPEWLSWDVVGEIVAFEGCHSSLGVYAPTAQWWAALEQSASPPFFIPDKRALRVISGLTHSLACAGLSAASVLCLAIEGWPCSAAPCDGRRPLQRGGGGTESPGCAGCSRNAPFPGLGEQLLAGVFGVGSCCLCCWEVLSAECALPLSVTSVPHVFQIPQVLVKLKKYPQGEKVSLEGCRLELFAILCATSKLCLS